jgi:hypothetical protein
MEKQLLLYKFGAGVGSRVVLTEDKMGVRRAWRH